MNYRGEEKIKIGNLELTLVMEYDRISKAEEALGLGIVVLAGLIATSRASLKQIVTILFYASGEQHPPSLIGNTILVSGVDLIGPPMVKFMKMAFSGGREEIEEDETSKELRP